MLWLQFGQVNSMDPLSPTRASSLPPSTIGNVVFSMEDFHSIFLNIEKFLSHRISHSLSPYVSRLINLELIE